MTHQDYSNTIAPLVSNQIYLRDKVYSDTPPNNPEFIPSGEYEGDSERFRVSNHILHAVMGMADEAGEILSCIHIKPNFTVTSGMDDVIRNYEPSSNLDRANLLEELGDYLWFLTLLCRELDIELKWVSDLVSKSEYDYSKILELSLHLNNHTSEVLGMAKKSLFYGKDFNQESVTSIVDGIDFTFGILLRRSGFTFEEVMKANLRKLKKRFGDALEFTEDKAINRDVDAERQALEGDE